MDTTLRASVLFFVLAGSWCLLAHCTQMDKVSFAEKVHGTGSMWQVQDRTTPISNKPQHILERDISSASGVGIYWVQSTEDSSQPLIMDSKDCTNCGRNSTSAESTTHGRINRNTNVNKRQFSQPEHSSGNIHWNTGNTSEGVSSRRVGDDIAMPNRHQQISVGQSTSPVSKDHQEPAVHVSQRRGKPRHPQKNDTNIQIHEHIVPPEQMPKSVSLQIPHLAVPQYSTLAQKLSAALSQITQLPMRNATDFHKHHRKEQMTVQDSNVTKPGADNSGGSPIVFPGNSGNSVIRFTPEEGKKNPKCASGQTFCPSIDTYPKEYLNSVLKNEVQLHRGVFGSDVILDNEIHFQSSQGSYNKNVKAKVTRKFHKIRSEIGIRIQPDEVALCVSTEEVVYPKTAQNKDGQWLFVVNHDEFIQGVRVEKCAKQGSCSLTDSFPLGYTTTCKQKYIYRKLLALGESGQTVSDSFRLPSCCSCVVIKSGTTAAIDHS